LGLVHKQIKTGLSTSKKKTQKPIIFDSNLNKKQKRINKRILKKKVMNQKFSARNTRPTSAIRKWKKRWMAQLRWMTQHPRHAKVLNVDTTSIPNSNQYKFPQ
jgi:hypothetical protein